MWQSRLRRRWMLATKLRRRLSMTSAGCTSGNRHTCGLWTLMQRQNVICRLRGIVHLCSYGPGGGAAREMGMSGSAPRFDAAASQESVRSRKRGDSRAELFLSPLAGQMIDHWLSLPRRHELLWWTTWVRIASITTQFHSIGDSTARVAGCACGCFPAKPVLFGGCWTD